MIEDTGERMIPEAHKGQLVYGEHMARYESVLGAVRGESVLDIACGTGYGTKMLATEAKNVIGVDISSDSIVYAKENFAGKNIEYRVGNAEKIPVDDHSVDAVVSFETIEHVENYNQFLTEVKRVLKPGGSFIVSTPNDVVFPEGNHFHLHEFEYEELLSLLKKHFRNVDPYFQGSWLYSGLFTKPEFGEEWTKPIKTHKSIPLKPGQAIYFTLSCSDMKPPKLTQTAVIAENWDPKGPQSVEGRIADLEHQVLETTRERNEYLQIIRNIHASKSWRLAVLIKKLSRASRFWKK